MSPFRERLKSLFGFSAIQREEGLLPDEMLQREFQRLKSVDPETNLQWIRLQNALEQKSAGIRVVQPRPIPRYAPGLAVAALAVVGIFLYITILAPSTDLFTTGIGGQMKVVLSDGSHVTLNYTTKVVVPQLREGEPRRVSLEGEAYFSVQHNKTPFIISTKYAQVEVVGTEFNLRARDGILEVAVVDGTVNVRVTGAEKDSTIRLTQNQRAICPQDGFPARVEDIPSSEYPGWMYGKLFLDKTPLIAACREIEMRFDVTIRIPNLTLRSEMITGVLDARGAESAVAALCELTGKKYAYDGKEYTLY